MRKTLTKLLLICMITCSLLLGTGCQSIFNDSTLGGGKVNSNVQSNGGPAYPTPGATGIETVIAGDKIYSSVKMNTLTERNKYDSCDQLDNAISKSVVMINSVTPNGTSLGAGVIIDVEVKTSQNVIDNGIFVLTCAHVVSGATNVTIKIADDYDEYETYKISSPMQNCLVGLDQLSDLAVLRFNKEDCITTLPQVVKAKICDTNVNPLQRGTEVYALGNPNGVEGWASNGIISRLKNSIYLYQLGTKMQLIGTTAPINAGNSGGGLFNMYGELVGIVNAGNSSLENFAYAIPIATTTEKEDTMSLGVYNVATQLILNKTTQTYGYVKGRIDLGAVFLYDTTYAASVSVLSNGSPIANAGIKLEDYVVTFKFSGTHNGNEVKGGADVMNYDTFFTELYKMQTMLCEDDPIAVNFYVKRYVYVSHGYYVSYTIEDITVSVTDFYQYVYTP